MLRRPRHPSLPVGRLFDGLWHAGWVSSGLDSMIAERERWMLWLPVAFGSGIAIYFSLDTEPSLWLAPLILPLVLLLASHFQRQSGDFDGALLATGLSIGLALMLLGFSITQYRTYAVEAPVLERRGAYQVEGEILLVEPKVRGERLVVGAPWIEGLEKDATPTKIRFSRRNAEPPLSPGDRIRVRAMLMPPSPPSEPHGFDFARRAYFEQLGAVGYSLEQPFLVAKKEGWQPGRALASLRQHFAAKISRAIEGPAGAVATALLTGLRGAIPDDVWHNMQAAGMAHLLAISGLHLGLVAGTVFFVARIALALIPPLALRWPTKKIAACVALVIALVYLLLTGATVPTQRAFIMTALMLLAVMVDRNPFSMRLVAWSALVVLLLQPESLLGASFQMSFAAVIALIAVYETGIGKPPAGAAGLDWRLFMYVAGVVLTTIIASAATAPLAVYHFGRLPTFSILANVLAVPLTAFWIMPLGLLGMLLLPFGVAGWCLQLMGLGIELMLDVAAWTAGLPGATVMVPRPPVASLVMVLLGGLWMALW
ncbi:MAG: ComEC/Rec2 family competence protein, partial [Geminicoccaceae bacterium]